MRPSRFAKQCDARGIDPVLSSVLTYVQHSLSTRRWPRNWFPFLATLFFFIWFSNMIG